ncbi:trypsin-like serine peptidase [Sinomonas mesophila]|uniref:trypsin-like serine peptidase n=1 Tax=Sinomonas mesophila TaxID=1531955 RepID=UPI000987839A|nr:hypothetical protein [Sinomonas mesophila]
MATKITTSLVSLASAILLALGAGAAGAASAAPSGNAGGNGSPQAASHRVENAAAAAEYWTAERMRSAVPGDVLAQRAVARGGTLPSVAQGSPTAKGAPTKVQGKTSLHTNEDPVSYIGKVFFTLGGQNYVCSGNAVASANRSTVSTAGHCLNEGPGAFVTNFVFVPKYLNGVEPYGRWAATSLHTTNEWKDHGNIAYDTGFAVVALIDSTGNIDPTVKLTDTVGSTGVAFNMDRGLTYKAYGYPAAKPFNGQSLISCTGQAGNDPYNPQFNTQGIPCDMNGGSSGGPWFIQGGGSPGYQNSVNSYGYSRFKVMYGPYWGDAVQNAYATAAAS